ncbi:MAG: 4Fe-4S binding protein [bacterium]|nr:4Fe-4S binding protein [bacterium]
MKRQIITIDEQKCTGCGLCINGCQEGAIKIIQGKARLVGDLYCDGLGACLNICPEGAITIIEREAEPYQEKEHSCPGSKMVDLRKKAAATESARGDIGSQLRQWPVQMHLISPAAPYFQGADVVLAADCVAYALGGFHADHLKNKSLAIACPKLDSGQDEYVAKIKSWIEEARINTLTVMIMQVPCCMGLVRLVQQAMEGVKRKVPVKKIVVGIDGEILQEEWL